MSGSSGLLVMKAKALQSRVVEVGPGRDTVKIGARLSVP